jgi:transglutaminase-like putative cysteine protease
MQLRVVHTTGFTYEGGAATSFNEARLTPQTLAGQIVVHTRLDVNPAPWSWSYRDYWGTQVTAFEVLDPHDSLTVTATATVHTEKVPLTSSTGSPNCCTSVTGSARQLTWLPATPRSATPARIQSQPLELSAP